jgi:hypothetical protein
MKRYIAPAMLGFGIALAVIIGQRMSTDAMAVVIGVAVGVAASVPTSLLLVALLRRQRSDERSSWRQETGPAYPQLQQPPVIVLNPGQWMGQNSGQQAFLPLPPTQLAQDGGVHRLRVIGDDDGW